jgi:predicted porin
MPAPRTPFCDRPSGRLTAVALLAMLLPCVGARAADLDTPKLSLSGYATVGLVHSSEKQADYTNGPWYKPHGAGHSSNWSADIDSRFGLQLDARLTPQLSAVLQVISQLRYDNTYTPAIEWANVKYSVTPDLSIRLGRIVMSTFLVSDYRNVGYAVPWVRPPLSLYNMMPVTSNDGVDASYRRRFGEATNTVQVFYGEGNQRSPNGQNNPARDSWGIINMLEYGPAIFRAAYQKSSLTLNQDINSFFNQFRRFGPAGAVLADKYDADNKPTIFWGISASYDPGNWYLMSEVGRSKLTPSFMGKQISWYASSGYRFGDVTPYVIYAKSRMLSNTSDPGLNVATVPPYLAGFAAGLNAGLNAFLKPTTGTTVTLGTRWDFMKNANIKLQYEQIHLDPGSSGLLINLQPGFQAGGKVNVVSAAVDFAF